MILWIVQPKPKIATVRRVLNNRPTHSILYLQFVVLIFAARIQYKIYKA
jgi:hypothetical protein